VYKKEFKINLDGPFRLDLTVWTLRRRKSNAVDVWDNHRYIRILTYNNTPIKISVTQNDSPTNPQLEVLLESDKEISNQAQDFVQNTLKMMLGVEINLDSFYSIAAKDKILGSLTNQFLGVKPPRFASIFEGLVNSVACQQVSLDVGILVLGRLSEKYGRKFQDKGQAFYSFPDPEDLVNIPGEDIKKLGFSYQKARTIKEIAANILDEKINLISVETMTNEEAVAYLSSVKGIGRWSSEYVLLRGFGKLDILPGDDVGAQNNLKRVFALENKPGYDEIQVLTSQWHPYEGLVYFHLLLEKLNLKGFI